MGETERYEVIDRTRPAPEQLRPEMTFLAENPEAFGLVADACPLATKHLLIAANGRSTEGGVGSPVYELEHPGTDGLFDFYGDLLSRNVENEEALNLVFGENSALREHPAARYCVALAEITALHVMNGPAREASYEKTLAMLNQELFFRLNALRDRFVELDRVEIIHDTVFEASVAVCRIREEGNGDYVAEIFSAGDFRIYLLDERGMAPLWSAVTPALSPDRGMGLRGASLRFHHPSPFAVLLVSESICALNAAEYRSLRSEPGLAWRYRMRLEDYFLRLITDCVREYEFGERAARFFVGRSHGRDSASGAMTVLRDGVSYETFRLHCQNRLSTLGRQMELLPNGYDPHNVPVRETRTRTELNYLRGLLENNLALTDRITNVLRLHILDKFGRTDRTEPAPPPADVPDYRRLDMDEVQKAFRRLDCENDGDRDRIAENHAILRESLSEHWVTLRPALLTPDETASASVREYRRVNDEMHGICLDMNRRLAEMLERRRGMISEIREMMARSLDIAAVEWNDWVCGRAGADSVNAWLTPLQRDLPARLSAVETDWRADTEQYRSLLSAYTAQRDDLFRRDILSENGAFAAEWQAVLIGELPEETWQTWRSRLESSPETAGFGDFLEALGRVSQGTGALLGRIRARAAENRMARELSNRLDLRIDALRGAAYEDPDWGAEIIASMDTATRNDFRATVRRWQENCRLAEQQRQAYEEYVAMYGAYEK